MKAMKVRFRFSEYRRPTKVILLLLVMSAMCCLMTVFRIAYTGNYTYKFLIWNLILAWVPLIAAYYLQNLFSDLVKQMVPFNSRTWLSMLILGGIWLLFLPNAPYILTDFVHLDDSGMSGRDIHLLYDATLIFSFALTGMLAGFVSLYWVHKVLNRLLPPYLSWAMVVGVLGLTGYGVYLGRVLRWNSWDILTHPRTLLWDVLTEFTHYTAFSLTVLFSAFLLGCYLALYGFLSISRLSTHD